VRRKRRLAAVKHYSKEAHAIAEHEGSLAGCSPGSLVVKIACETSRCARPEGAAHSQEPYNGSASIVSAASLRSAILKVAS
jgi:hypothetical protein